METCHEGVPEDLDARGIEAIGDVGYDAWRARLDRRMRLVQLSSWFRCAPALLRPALSRQLLGTHHCPCCGGVRIDDDTAAAIGAAIARCYPSEVERARALLEWFGRDRSPWLAPAGGAVLTLEALNSLPFEARLEAWRAQPELLTAGVARCLLMKAGMRAPHQWVHLLTAPERATILAFVHERQSATARRRAAWALASSPPAGPSEKSAVANETLLAHLSGAGSQKTIEPLRWASYQAASEASEAVIAWVDRIAAWGHEATLRAGLALLSIAPDADLERAARSALERGPAATSIADAARVTRQIAERALAEETAAYRDAVRTDRRKRDQRPRPDAALRGQVRGALQRWLQGEPTAPTGR